MIGFGIQLLIFFLFVAIIVKKAKKESSTSATTSAAAEENTCSSTIKPVLGENQLKEDYFRRITLPRYLQNQFGPILSYKINYPIGSIRNASGEISLTVYLKDGRELRHSFTLLQLENSEEVGILPHTEKKSDARNWLINHASDILDKVNEAKKKNSYMVSIEIEDMEEELKKEICEMISENMGYLVEPEENRLLLNIQVELYNKKKTNPATA